MGVVRVQEESSSEQGLVIKSYVYCDHCGSWHVSVCKEVPPRSAREFVIPALFVIGIVVSVILTYVTGGLVLICLFPLSFFYFLRRRGRKKVKFIGPPEVYRATCTQCGKRWNAKTERATPVRYTLTEGDISKYARPLEAARNCSR